MIVNETQWPDGSSSYQWVSWTPDDLVAIAAAPDQNAWVADNATVASTLVMTSMPSPPST